MSVGPNYAKQHKSNGKYGQLSDQKALGGVYAAPQVAPTHPRALLVLFAVAILTVGLLSLVGAEPAWAESRSFAPAQNYLEGTNPYSVASADFDGDGKADLATAHIRSNNVSVLLGKGDGTFQDAQTFSVGTAPLSVASADFNGDGKADLVTSNLSGNSVSVLLGKGDGTFQEAQNLQVGSRPRSVTSGHFNDDGEVDFLDLAVANETSDNVSILLGNGDGTFQDAQNLQVGDTPVSITSADLDGDNKADDLATANNPFDSRIPDGISVLLGNDDGTFQPVQNLAAGVNPRQVIAADLDGDVKADGLMVANWGRCITGGGSLSLLLSNGDGTFQDPQEVTAVHEHYSLFYSVTVADFDGDGTPDLAATTDTCADFPTQVVVYSGNGDGTFNYPQEFPVGIHPESIINADLNADNYADLAVANRGSGSQFAVSGSVSVLLNTLEPPDVTPPMLRYYSPDCSSCQYSTSTNVTATFSEDMDPDTITKETFKLYKRSSGLVEADVRYDSETKTAILDPVSDLDPWSLYDADIYGGSSGMKDLAGNPLSQQGGYYFYFQTEQETTTPTVGSVSPTNTATDVALNTDAEATFSEAMNAATITSTTFTLTKQGSASPVAATVSYDAATKTAKLDPSSNLDSNTIYTATIKGGSSGAKDSVGNALKQDYSWTFTTAPAPTVVSYAPTETTGVPRSTQPTATFSTDMEASTISAANNIKLQVYNKRKKRWRNVAHTVTYDAPSRTVTVTPDSTLAASRKYRVTITTNVQSSARVALDQDDTTSGNQPKSWIFRTGST